MTLRIGDAVFLPDGRPGVLVSENKQRDAVSVVTDKKVVSDAHRHGYLNGVKPDVRNELYEILDRVKEIPEPEKRIDELRSKIEELSIDPKNMVLTRYLTAEMAHIMNMAGVRPRVFEVDSFKLR